MEYLIKKLFGTSSEKTKKLEGRYNLFDEAEQETISTDETEIAESVPVKEYTSYLLLLENPSRVIVYTTYYIGSVIFCIAI